MPPKKNKSKIEGKKEKTLEKSLKDPVYVNYNILLKLEEIKKINYGIFQILNELLFLLDYGYGVITKH